MSERQSVPLAELEALHLEPEDLVIVRCPADVSVDQAQAAFYAVREALPDHRALIVHGDWQVSGARFPHMVSGLKRAMGAATAANAILPDERAALESLLDALEACGQR